MQEILSNILKKLDNVLVVNTGSFFIIDWNGSPNI